MEEVDFKSPLLRVMWIIYSNPEGITAERLVEELKKRGWCDADATPQCLGYQPGDVLRRPPPAANER